MKWNHLPNGGGLYDQDPDLMDKFEHIFHKISEHEAAEAAKEKAASAKNSRLGKAGGASPRSTRIRNR